MTTSARLRTILLWALVPIVLLAVPIVWTLLVSLDTGGDTEAIKDAQAAATAAQANAVAAAEAAVRNGAVSACSSTYAATYDGWLAEFTRTASDPVQRQQAAVNAVEMDRRRLGVALLSREHPTDPFDCPPIPARLVIEPWDPLDPNRPPDLAL